MNRSLVRLPSLALLALAAASAEAVTVSTVGAYAPNPNGVTIVDATSNAALGGITMTSFQTLVGAAFIAGNGGVVDAETPNGMVQGTYYLSIDALIGTTTGVETITRTDSTVNGFDSGNDSANAVSGTNYIGEQAASPTFAFSKNLSAFGVTMIPRGAARSSQLTFTMDNGATYTTSLESIDTTKTARFFGAQAPAGRSFTSVSFADVGGLVRYDDLGFVVAASPVPEPTTLAALALGGLAVLRKRRR